MNSIINIFFNKDQVTSQIYSPFYYKKKIKTNKGKSNTPGIHSVHLVNSLRYNDIILLTVYSIGVRYLVVTFC